MTSDPLLNDASPEYGGTTDQSRVRHPQSLRVTVPKRQDSVVSASIDPEQSPSHSSLLGLPDELRVIIYKHLLSYPTGPYLCFGTPDPGNPASALTALSQVNHQLRREYLPLLHSLPALTFHIPLLRDHRTPRNANPVPRVASSSANAVRNPTASQLRRLAEEFRDAALIRPALRAAVERFTHTCEHVPEFRTVKVELGSQTRTTFLPAFDSAWTMVGPGLQALRMRVREVRVGFALRLSKRVVGEFEFSVTGTLGKALAEMDRGLRCEGHGDGGEEGWTPTPHELAAVNGVRRTVGQGLWPREKIDEYWHGPRWDRDVGSMGG